MSWHGDWKGHHDAVLKGLRRKGHGYIDYKPSRSKLAFARDRTQESKSQPWERETAMKQRRR